MNRLPLNEGFSDKRGEIIRRLTDLRNDLADKVGLERYKVLQNKTIDFIADSMPQTLKELAGVKGIGPKKLKDFGPAILAITKGTDRTEEEKDVQLTERGEVIFSVREFLEKINDLLA